MGCSVWLLACFPMGKHRCSRLQALAARDDAGAVFATAIFGQHTLSVATETLLQVVRRTELTGEARMAAAAVLAHLACEHCAVGARETQARQGQAWTASPAGSKQITVCSGSCDAPALAKPLSEAVGTSA